MKLNKITNQNIEKMRVEDIVNTYNACQLWKREARDIKILKMYQITLENFACFQEHWYLAGVHENNYENIDALNDSNIKYVVSFQAGEIRKYSTIEESITGKGISLIEIHYNDYSTLLFLMESNPLTFNKLNVKTIKALQQTFLFSLPYIAKAIWG